MQSLTPAFDLDTANAEIGKAIADLIKLMFRRPGEMPDETTSKAALDAILKALGAGSSACGEVKRLRGELGALREAHRPRPHADPSAPGALCDACSLGGALIAWPCEPWHAVDRVLNRKTP